MRFLLLLLISCASFASSIDFTEEDFEKLSALPHQVKILNHGIAALEERLQLIEEAQHSIDVEYYIFRQDFASQIITRALLKKAKEGIRVRILLDYFANKKSPNPHVLAMVKSEGVDVRFFNTSPLISFFNVQYRNHRKALIVDNNIAVIGGRNIANEYFDLSQYYNFLDRDMTISGGIVKAISHTFELNFQSRWTSPLKLPKKPSLDDQRYLNPSESFPDEKRYKNDLKRWERNQKDAKNFLFGDLDIQRVRDLGAEKLGLSFLGECNKVTFLSEVPAFGRKRKYARLLKELIQRKIEEAKNNIIIESPYFILTDEFRKVVDKALDTKVQINLLTNSINSTDQVLVYSAFESQLYGLLHQNLNTYIATGKRPSDYDVLPHVEFSQYGIHSKTFVFDDKDFIISTFNIDPRSSDINSELLILCEDSPHLASLIKDNIQERMKETYHISSSGDLLDATYKKGKLKKIIYFLLSKIPARLLKPFL